MRLRCETQEPGAEPFVDGRGGGAQLFEITFSLRDDLLYMVRQERRPYRKNIGD